MTKPIKRYLSLLLTLVLVLALFSGMTCSASAAYKGEITVSASVGVSVTAADVSTALTSAGVGAGDTYSVAVASGVTAIDANAFSGRYGLTSVTIPDSVASIGNNAFNYCYGLTSVTVPASVTSIGDSAFGYCRGLAEVEFLGSMPTFGANVFQNCSVNITLYYQAGYTVSWSSYTGTERTSNINTKAVGGECLITSLTWNGIKGTIDNTTNTIVLFVPDGTTISGVTPAVEISGGAVTSDGVSYDRTYTVTDSGKTRAYALLIRYESADTTQVVSVTPRGSAISVSANKLVITFSVDSFTDVLYTPSVTIDNGATLSNPVWSENNTVLTYTLGGLSENKTYNVLISGFYINGSENYRPLIYSSGFSTFSSVTPDTYGVTYDANGGSGSQLTVAGFDYGSAHDVLPLSETGFSRNGYDFTGWNLKADGSGTDYAPDDRLTVTNNVTLYAQWIPSTATYTVIYDANGGTGGHSVESLQDGAVHKVLTQSDATVSRTGYDFAAWNTAADGSGTAYAPDDDLTVTGNITLYAQWETGSWLDTDNHFAYAIGYDDGEVKPQNNITRAEAATIFFRLLTQEYRAEVWSKSNSFSDVSSGSWYNNAISTLTNAGILNGYSNGSFNPNGSITRAEFASIAVRFADVSGIDTSGYDNAFTDISGHWAEDNIKLAAALGYVNGYNDGSFSPNEYITRAEVMTLLNRVLGRSVESDDDMTADMITWPDNKSDKWYYLDVQEATNSHYYESKSDGVNETWTELREAPDWSALEKTGSKPGDVSY